MPTTSLDVRWHVNHSAFASNCGAVTAVCLTRGDIQALKCQNSPDDPILI